MIIIIIIIFRLKFINIVFARSLIVIANAELWMAEYGRIRKKKAIMLVQIHLKVGIFQFKSSRF